MAPDASPKSRVRFVSGSRVQMGPSGMVWESSATGLGRTGQPKSQANRKRALIRPYKALIKCLIRPYKALSRLKNKPYKSLYGLIFGAILNTLGNLEPFWNHFGTVFRLSLRHLQVSIFRRPDVKNQRPVRAIFLKMNPYLDQAFW